MNLVRFDTTEQWLDARRGLVTGSKVPTILGSPGAFGTPLSLWSEEVGISVVDKDGIAERLWWGSKMESLIAERLQMEANVLVERTPLTLVYHPTIPEFACSLDGICITGDGRRGAVEFKNVDRFLLDEWSDGVPLKVRVQVLFNLECAELDFGLAAGCIGGNALKWESIDRDPVWFEEHRPALLDFARRLREQDPPEPTDSPADAQALAALHAVENGETIALPVDAIEWTNEIEVCDLERDAAAGRATWRRNQIRALLGAATKGVLPDGRFWTWKTNKGGSRVLLAGKAKKEV